MNAEEELEAGIVASPDDRDAYQVYGDWLAEQGDPLGELVAVHVALEKKPRDRTLIKREEALVEEHREAWLGEWLAYLQDEGEIALDWRWGFLQRVVIGRGVVEDHDGVEAFSEIATCKAAKFIRELQIGALIKADKYTKIISAIAKQGVPKTLRRFEIDSSEMSRCDLGKLERLYPAITHVQEIALVATEMDLGSAIELEDTETLEISAEPILAKHLKSIANAKCPKLKTLRLDFRNREARWLDPAPPADLAKALDAPGLPALDTLRLWNTRWTNEYAANFPSSKLLPRLKELDLSRGDLSDDGALTFVNYAAAFKHLKKLDLSRNNLTKASIDRLKAMYGKKIDVQYNAPQKPAARTMRFIE
jgi:uncharacterized protein (TIGR02996 family)